MALNKYYLKKWIKMITGKSILHVKQNEGKHYSKDHISGYYNDLREKVLRANLEENDLPITELPNGKKIEFSIAIFQYGLGAYDLYLETNDTSNLNRFYKAVNWAINNIDENGGWKTFEYSNKENPYSAMAQGEGISLLCRAYCINASIEIHNYINKAMELLIKNEKKNGCTQYNGDEVRFKEYPLDDTVLNGWIFTIFGIYDYLLINNKNKKIKGLYKKSIKTIESDLSKYDLGYWSKYDDNTKIASPFYHNLHIALLKVLFDLTNNESFLVYSEKFDLYRKNRFNYLKAFLKKAIQKIRE